MTIEAYQVRKVARTPEHYLLDLMIDGEAGIGWYERAHSDIKNFANAVGASVDEVAAVTSIMSPRTSVDRCAKMSANFFLTGSRPEGLMQQRWDSVVEYYKTFNVGSHKALKIKNFARALAGDYSSCVCDTWIAAVFNVDYGKNGLSVGAYHAATERISSIADEAGITVCDAQAALWVGKRIEVGTHLRGSHVADKSLCKFLPDFIS